MRRGYGVIFIAFVIIFVFQIVILDESSASFHTEQAGRYRGSYGGTHNSNYQIGTAIRANSFRQESDPQNQYPYDPSSSSYGMNNIDYGRPAYSGSGCNAPTYDYGTTPTNPYYYNGNLGANTQSNPTYGPYLDPNQYSDQRYMYNDPSVCPDPFGGYLDPPVYNDPAVANDQPIYFDPQVANDPPTYFDPLVENDPPTYYDPLVANDPPTYYDPLVANDPSTYYDPLVANDPPIYFDPPAANDPPIYFDPPAANNQPIGSTSGLSGLMSGLDFSGLMNGLIPLIPGMIGQMLGGQAGQSIVPAATNTVPVTTAPITDTSTVSTVTTMPTDGIDATLPGPIDAAPSELPVSSGLSDAKDYYNHNTEDTGKCKPMLIFTPSELNRLELNKNEYIPKLSDEELANLYNSLIKNKKTSVLLLTDENDKSSNEIDNIFPLHPLSFPEDNKHDTNSIENLSNNFQKLEISSPESTFDKHSHESTGDSSSTINYTRVRKHNKDLIGKSADYYEIIPRNKNSSSEKPPHGIEPDSLGEDKPKSINSARIRKDNEDFMKQLSESYEYIPVEMNYSVKPPSGVEPQATKKPLNTGSSNLVTSKNELIPQSTLDNKSTFDNDSPALSDLKMESNSKSPKKEIIPVILLTDDVSSLHHLMSVNNSKPVRRDSEDMIKKMSSFFDFIPRDMLMPDSLKQSAPGIEIYRSEEGKSSGNSQRVRKHNEDLIKSMSDFYEFIPMGHDSLKQTASGSNSSEKEKSDDNDLQRVRKHNEDLIKSMSEFYDFIPMDHDSLKQTASGSNSSEKEKSHDNDLQRVRKHNEDLIKSMSDFYEFIPMGHDSLKQTASRSNSSGKEKSDDNDLQRVRKHNEDLIKSMSEFYEFIPMDHDSLKQTASRSNSSGKEKSDDNDLQRVRKHNDDLIKSMSEFYEFIPMDHDSLKQTASRSNSSGKEKSDDNDLQRVRKHNEDLIKSMSEFYEFIPMDHDSLKQTASRSNSSGKEKSDDNDLQRVRKHNDDLIKSMSDFYEFIPMDHDSLKQTASRSNSSGKEKSDDNDLQRVRKHNEDLIKSMSEFYEFIPMDHDSLKQTASRSNSSGKEKSDDNDLQRVRKHNEDLIKSMSEFYEFIPMDHDSLKQTASRSNSSGKEKSDDNDLQRVRKHNDDLIKSMSEFYEFIPMDHVNNNHDSLKHTASRSNSSGKEKLDENDLPQHNDTQRVRKHNKDLIGNMNRFYEYIPTDTPSLEGILPGFEPTSNLDENSQSSAKNINQMKNIKNTETTKDTNSFEPFEFTSTPRFYRMVPKKRPSKRISIGSQLPVIHSSVGDLFDLKSKFESNFNLNDKFFVVEDKLKYKEYLLAKKQNYRAWKKGVDKTPEQSHNKYIFRLTCYDPHDSHSSETGDKRFILHFDCLNKISPIISDILKNFEKHHFYSSDSHSNESFPYKSNEKHHSHIYDSSGGGFETYTQPRSIYNAASGNDYSPRLPKEGDTSSVPISIKDRAPYSIDNHDPKSSTSSFLTEPLHIYKETSSKDFGIKGYNHIEKSTYDDKLSTTLQSNLYTGNYQLGPDASSKSPEYVTNAYYTPKIVAIGPNLPFNIQSPYEVLGTPPCHPTPTYYSSSSFPLQTDLIPSHIHKETSSNIPEQFEKSIRDDNVKKYSVKHNPNQLPIGTSQSFNNIPFEISKSTPCQCTLKQNSNNIHSLPKPQPGFCTENYKSEPGTPSKSSESVDLYYPSKGVNTVSRLPSILRSPCEIPENKPCYTTQICNSNTGFTHEPHPIPYAAQPKSDSLLTKATEPYSSHKNCLIDSSHSLNSPSKYHEATPLHSSPKNVLNPSYTLPKLEKTHPDKEQTAHRACSKSQDYDKNKINGLSETVNEFPNKQTLSNSRGSIMKISRCDLNKPKHSGKLKDLAFEGCKTARNSTITLENRISDAIDSLKNIQSCHNGKEIPPGQLFLEPKNTIQASSSTGTINPGNINGGTCFDNPTVHQDPEMDKCHQKEYLITKHTKEVLKSPNCTKLVHDFKCKKTIQSNSCRDYIGHSYANNDCSSCNGSPAVASNECECLANLLEKISLTLDKNNTKVNESKICNKCSAG